MKAKFINEAMSDILRPKDIGDDLVENSLLSAWHREDIEDVLKDSFDPDDYEDVEELFIEFISSDALLGSALEVYLPQEQRQKLFDLYKQGYDIATYFLDDGGPIAFDPNDVLPEGWELFWHEDNIDQGELIFVKKP